MLVGKSVMTRYNNTIYRIDDIDFASTPSDSFLSDDDDNMISFSEYYQKKYNVKVRNINQPMLINRVEMHPTKDNERMTLVHCLIPEFCYPIYNEW